MLLRALCTALVVALWAVPAAAQSLSPMRNDGETPSLVKGFKLYVGNPYRTKMTFVVTPMDPKFQVPVADAAVNFPEITMAPGATRQVIVTFRIGRLIAACSCMNPRSHDGGKSIFSSRYSATPSVATSKPVGSMANSVRRYVRSRWNSSCRASE